MNIFVTGASGYIGRAVTGKLRAAGHAVRGLARSGAAAEKLKAIGAEPVAGDLRDSATIEAAARNSDVSIHLAMEFSAEAPALDRAAIDALIAAQRPFVYTSGIWVMGDTGGHVADETTPVHPTPLVAWRTSHEKMVLDARGVVIRPAMVFGRNGGFVAGFVEAAKTGVVQIVGTGENRWPFVHVDDLADLYVLALRAQPGSLYFAAAGPSIPVKQVAAGAAALEKGARVETIPLEKARQTMGLLADALVLDQLISARKVMQELGWNPKAESVLEELSLA
jgi:nucleoside-diphosphate-sugar epimerase